MLYALHEMQHAMLAPFEAFAGASHALFTQPHSPWAHTPVSRTFAAANELVMRLVRRYEKPDWRIEGTVIDGRTVPVTIERAVVQPFCDLLHFRRDTKRNDPRVLVVAPLSGHHATLLRDTVRTMLPEHDVYVTDWIDARMVPVHEGHFHLDDYVEYVEGFIRYLGPDVHVVSVCQPTVPVLAAVSLMASRKEKIAPLTMTMMGGPIDTRRSPTAVNSFATGRPLSWFESRVIQRVPGNYPGVGRRVYPGFLQHISFIMMNADRHVEAHRDFFNHLIVGDGDSAAAHRRFYDEYNAVLDMAAEYYLETLRVVFKEHALPLGTWQVRHEPVRPQDITRTALFTIEGELDDISGVGQTEAAHGLCTNIPAAKREHFLVDGVGHYGIFSGRRYRERIYPRIRDFIRRHA
ncbi:MAG: polyhydroxyalkanoate depolymerase [Betaproteobacteria bacterium]|nr:polyhydroxyalkanoate depolymerase [Betaproteobacteria bacterium]